MTFLLRFAPTLLLLSSVLALAKQNQPDVSTKTVVRGTEVHQLPSALPCS